MPCESNGACNYCLNSSIHLSLLKGGMYLRDNPAALIMSNMPKSILPINAVRKGCVFTLWGKVVYSYGWVGEGGQYWSQCYTAAVQFELVKFPSSPCAFPLSRSRSQLFSVQNVHCAYARASNINPRVEIIGL